MFLDKIDSPNRHKKPRSSGLTSIHDVSLSVGEAKMILEDYSDYVDICKLGVGTAAVTPRLKEKISMYHDHSVKVYFGGTLFEKFYHQKKLEDLKKIILDFDIDYVEISTGTLDMELQERIDLIPFFSESGIDVLCEVGSKDNEKVMPPRQWIHEIETLLDSGASYVITEGRNSGTAGIFRPSGELRAGLVDDIINSIGYEKLIIEAPTSKSQMFLIKLVGSNVNLGNVNPHDLLLLEAQRVGLRSETFFMDNE